MLNLMNDAIRMKIRAAEAKHLRYARLQRTGDENVDKAVMQLIESWGYKTALGRKRILVIW